MLSLRIPSMFVLTRPALTIISHCWPLTAWTGFVGGKVKHYLVNCKRNDEKNVPKFTYKTSNHLLFTQKSLGFYVILAENCPFVEALHCFLISLPSPAETPCFPGINSLLR